MRRLVIAALTVAILVLPPSAAAERAAVPSTRIVYFQAGNAIDPLNASTLANAGTPLSIEDPQAPGIPQWIVGSLSGRLTTISYQTDAQKAIILRVFDPVTGTEYARFGPDVPLLADGMSRDGSQIFGQWPPDTSESVQSWYVIDGSTGRLIHQLNLKQNPCCGDFRYEYDPSTSRLYVLAAPTTEGTTARHPVLRAYDLDSGRKVAQRTLPSVLGGSWLTGQKINGKPVHTWWNPGFALSPDGQTIAVLDGSTDKLQLIRSADLRIEQTVKIVPSAAMGKRVQSVSLLLRFSRDGLRLYSAGIETTVVKGKMQTTYPGWRAIDVASGHVTGVALRGRNAPAAWQGPDGSLYVLAYRGSRCPCDLERLDPMTLEVKAQRQVPTIGNLVFF